MVKPKSKKRKKRSDDKLIQALQLVLSLAIIALIIVSWGSISWIVNGDVWRQILSDAFPDLFPRPYVLVTKDPGTNVPVQNKDPGNPVKDPGTATTTPPIPDRPRMDRITIPKIGITAPIVTARTDNSEVIHGLLDSGVVLYPGSVTFGDKGQTVLLGHSSPAGWPKIKYDWVFTRINELRSGDMVVITYNYKTHYYNVVKTRIVTPQEGVPETTVEGNSLMLVSCWPPGKDLKRIAVEATILDK